MTGDHEWVFPEEDETYCFSKYDDSLACCTLLENGKWRWEVYRKDFYIVIDMDGWWGITDCLSDAQLAAEIAIHDQK